jgi:hypothetical protein
VYVVGTTRQLQYLYREFVCFLLDEFFETVTYFALKHRFAVLRTPDEVVLEFVDVGTFSVEPTRHRQYIDITHLKMLRKHPTPAVATSVERLPVVGFIHTGKRVGFRLATAVTVPVSDGGRTSGQSGCLTFSVASITI